MLAAIDWSKISPSPRRSSVHGDACEMASRGLRCRSLAIDRDSSASRRRNAEERQANVGAPRADETGEAEDLARAQVEGDALEGSLAAQVLDLEHDLARVRASCACRTR